jgi:putative hydrolase of the HAD superfamily
MIRAKLLVFDLDDTLLDTSALFFQIKRDFFEHLRQAGFDEQQIQKEYERIDDANIARLGYISERTIVSLRETMELLYQTRKKNFSQADLQALAAVGSQALFAIPGLMPYSVSVLSWCKQHFRLALLTRGSVSYQQVKLNSSGLSSFFEYTNVVPLKNAAAFEHLLEAVNIAPAEAVSIGDSARYDILPALSVGMKAIHVKYPRPEIQWNHDKDAAQPPVQMCTVKDLREVQKILEGEGLFVSCEQS